MRRSLLFIPSNAPAMLQNADVFAADAVIFDLEDSVIPSEKDAARNLLNQFLKQFKDIKIEKIVRINAMDTPYFYLDLDFLLNSEIDAIMLPKATKETTILLAKKIIQHEKKFKHSKPIYIIPIIELASSVIEVDEIAKIHKVNGLLLGGEDLATNLEVERSESSIELLYARSKVIYAAKANSIDAIDTPYTNTLDDEGLIKDASFAKSLGMNAKALIHPNQIDHVNEIFSPTQKEILYAKKVLLAQQQAIKDKKGAFSVDGKMIDKPIIIRCEKIIEKAEKWHL